MKRWPSEASVKFLVKLFSKSLRLVRRSLTPLPLWRAAHEEKLGKQGLCPAFPGRWGSCPLSHGCRRASSPKGGAKSRLPLWGRCHAFGMTERARCQRPLRMGCVEALASCPLSRLAATALPKGEPSLASPLGGGAPLWGAERVRRPPPPKALLQSIEISAILKVHGIPCGSLPRNGTSRLLAQSTGRTACNRSDCIFAKAKNRCSLAAGPSQEVWTSCLHSPLWGAL